MARALPIALLCFVASLLSPGLPVVKLKLCLPKGLSDAFPNHETTSRSFELK